ncbi:MAG TPA: response regulator transcription factor [Balneolaceae bacterium]
MKPISIIIADDHEIVRYGIRIYLSQQEDIEIVGEAASGKECLKLCKEKKPDLCLLDISMPDKNGIETAKNLREIDPGIKILILSMYEDEQVLNDVLKIGINGYLLKGTGKDELLNGIRVIMKGQQIFSESISKMITDSFLSKKINNLDSRTDLTKRELEILKLIVDGKTSKEIANELFISPRTVDTHRANLMQKLELNNIADLVRYAIKENLVTT